MKSLFENRTVVIVIGVVLVALIFAYVIIYRSNSSRYYMVPGKDGIAYKIDRKTGKTWVVRGTTVKEVEEPKVERKQGVVPDSIVRQLTGKASYTAKTFFKGEIYNPTEWRMREITVEIWNEGKGDDKWRRKFVVKDANFRPMGTGYFMVNTIDGNTAKATKWRIISAKGSRE